MSFYQDFLIGSLPVKFPYEPYDVQKAYMSKVMACLQVKMNFFRHTFIM